MKMMCSKLTAKRKVDSENRIDWKMSINSSSNQRMCLICQETIAVMKISNWKHHYKMKLRRGGDISSKFRVNVGDLGADNLGDIAGRLTTSSTLPLLAWPPSAAPMSTGCSGGCFVWADSCRGATSAGRISSLLRRYAVPSTLTR